jgi:hypothetical protein
VVYLHQIKDSVLGVKPEHDYMPAVRQDFLQLLNQVMLSDLAHTSAIYVTPVAFHMRVMAEAMEITLFQLHEAFDFGPRAESYATALSRVVKEYWESQLGTKPYPEWLKTA